MRTFSITASFAVLGLLSAGCLTTASFIDTDAATKADSGDTGKRDAAADTGKGHDAGKDGTSPSGDAHHEATTLADAGHDGSTSSDDAGHDSGHDTGFDAGHDAGHCVPIPGVPVSWWRGEGDPTDAFAKNNGTWSGTPAYADGVVGKAFSISAMAVVTATTTGLPVGNAARTVEFWAQIEQAGSDGDQQTFIEYGTSSTSKAFAVFAGAKIADAEVSVLDFSQWTGSAPSSYVMPTATWAHIAVTYTGAVLTIYVNGAVVGSQTSPVIATQASPTLYIGGAGTLAFGDGGVTDGHIHRLTGLIDELTIYSSALMATDIANIYTAGSWGKCYPPI